MDQDWSPSVHGRREGWRPFLYLNCLSFVGRATAVSAATRESRTEAEIGGDSNCCSIARFPFDFFFNQVKLAKNMLRCEMGLNSIIACSYNAAEGLCFGQNRVQSERGNPGGRLREGERRSEITRQYPFVMGRKTRRGSNSNNVS